MTRRRALALAPLVAALAIGAAPARASVEDVVAPGPGGTAAFAFPYDAGGFSQIHERSWNAETMLGFSEAISWARRHSQGQRIGVDAAGRTLVAWLGSDGEENVVLIRRRSPDGSLGPIQPLTPAGADPAYVEMAVEPDGDATVVWTRSYPSEKRVVQSRKRSADGTLGLIKTLSGTLGLSQSPQVAVTPGGAATVVWTRADSEAVKYAQTRTVAADGSLSPIQTLTPTNAIAGPPQVIVGDQGTAVFSFTTAQGLQARARSAGGVLGARQTVAGPEAFEHRMAGDRSGRAAFTWTMEDSDAFVQGRIRSPNGVLGPTFDFGEGGSPRVALDRDGHATFAWVVAQVSADVVVAQRRTVTGTLGPAREISDESPTAYGPRVVVDDAGKATIAFRDSGALYARSMTPSGTLSPVRHVDGP